MFYLFIKLDKTIRIKSHFDLIGNYIGKLSDELKSILDPEVFEQKIDSLEK